MKRALLIAGGTVGGLGAVLAITPPQLSSTSTVGANPGTSIPSATKAPAATKAPSATSTPKQNSKPTSKATTSSKPTAAATTPAAPATTGGSKNVNETFTGSAVDVGYGTVQVKITVVNGKITDAQAVQAPSGRNDRYTNMAVPILRQRTLAAQSANINGASGASYTSFGWYTSLTVALKQAGL
jgi:uncharacterized protein with FMN-binding domain